MDVNNCQDFLIPIQASSIRNRRRRGSSNAPVIVSGGGSTRDRESWNWKRRGDTTSPPSRHSSLPRRARYWISTVALMKMAGFVGHRHRHIHIYSRQRIGWPAGINIRQLLALIIILYRSSIHSITIPPRHLWHKSVGSCCWNWKLEVEEKGRRERKPAEERDWNTPTTREISTTIRYHHMQRVCLIICPPTVLTLC